MSHLHASLETSHATLFESRRSFLKGSLVVAGFGLLGGGSAARALFAEDRVVSGKLIRHTEIPLNAEPPLKDLMGNWITPVESFYVRSHGANPEIDPATFRLSISGMVEQESQISLAELASRYPATKVTATMCCAGNRREEMIAQKAIEGVPWGAGALGNGVWGGVRLADVIKQAKVSEGARHIWFEGLDTHEKKGKPIVFGGSIPLERLFAEDKGADVLLATELNGEPLTPDHGAPLRTVVPGYIGARSVKWLSKVILSDRPSDNYYIQDAYRIVANNTPEAMAQADIIYQLPIQSVICEVGERPTEPRGKLTVKGYALPPGEPGRTIARVEVSANDGGTWQTATLAPQSQPYCWRLWEADVRVTRRTEKLLVRTIDSSWQMQPETVPWNAKGYMQNPWHSAPLKS